MRDRILNLVLRAPASLGSRARITFLRMLGAQIGPNCRIESIQMPRNPWDICLGEGTALDKGVVLLTTGDRQSVPRITFGPRVYINRWTMIDASCSIQIGADVMVGPGCYITDHDHGTEVGKVIGGQSLVEAPTSIGDNVWIGAHVKILKGVTVGDHAVVGAGSVVTRSVEACERVAGIPARPIA